MLSDFYIDTFEVTVDRFRAFVDAYPGSKPVAGAGAHPKIGGSGWDASWPLPADSAALVSAISCVDSSTGAPVHTWTTLSGSAKKNHPINCVDWYVAFAFCAWDHGRLPTEAEWEYAAAGGSENRLLPWGLTDEPDCSYMTCGTDPLSVGSSLAGTSRWAQRDMSGNVWEWVLDSYAFKYTSSTCTDCANTAFDSSPGGIFRPRVIRGGGVIAGSHTDARAAARSYTTVGMLGGYLGFRCARDL